MSIKLISHHLNNIQTVMYERLCGRYSASITQLFRKNALNLENLGEALNCGTTPDSLPTPAEMYLGFLKDLGCQELPKDMRIVRLFNARQIGEYFARGFLTQPEALALWIYVRLAPGVDGHLEEMTDLAYHLCIPNEYDKFVLRVAREGVLGKYRGDKLFQANGGTELPDAVNVIVAKQLETDGYWRDGAKLEGLDPVSYQHPADRQALAALARISIMKKISEKLTGLNKRNYEILAKANCIEVTPFTMPDVYALYLKACDRLCMKTPPALYVEQGGIHSRTAGTDEDPMIILSSGAISMLDKVELMFALGCELGHVACNHVMNGTLADMMASTAVTHIPIIGDLISATAGLTVRPVLYAWRRRSKLTADRAGLLACQNAEAALRVMMKGSGVPFSHFPTIKTRALLQQVIDFRRNIDESALDRAFNLLATMNRSAPWLVWRAEGLMNWIWSGGYSELAEGTLDTRLAIGQTIRQNPETYDFLSGVADAVALLAEQHYGVHRTRSYPVIRRMIYNQCVPESGSPLGMILSLNIKIRRSKSGTMKYTIQVERLDFKEGVQKALIEEYALDHPEAWEDTPGEVQSAMIRMATSEYTMELYNLRNAD